jgi:hypothetical protein
LADLAALEHEGDGRPGRHAKRAAEASIARLKVLSEQEEDPAPRQDDGNAEPSLLIIKIFVLGLIAAFFLYLAIGIGKVFL